MSEIKLSTFLVNQQYDLFLPLHHKMDANFQCKALNERFEMFRVHFNPLLDINRTLLIKL